MPAERGSSGTLQIVLLYSDPRVECRETEAFQFILKFRETFSDLALQRPGIC